MPGAQNSNPNPETQNLRICEEIQLNFQKVVFIQYYFAKRMHNISSFIYCV